MSGAIETVRAIAGAECEVRPAPQLGRVLAQQRVVTRMNLLDLLREQVGTQLSARAPALLDVTAHDAEAVVARLLPALLGGMVQRAGTERGARELFDAVTDPSIDTSLVSDPAAGLVGGEVTERLLMQGKRLARSVFGDRVPALRQGLSESTGIDAAQSGNWLSLTLPLLAANLKKLIWRENLDAKGFTALLAGQARYLEPVLDTKLLAALGVGSGSELFGGAADIAARLAGPARDRSRAERAPEVSASARSGLALGWKLLAWLALLLLALWGLLKCDRTPTEPTGEAVVEPAKEAPAPAGAVPAEVVVVGTAPVPDATGNEAKPEGASEAKTAPSPQVAAAESEAVLSRGGAPDATATRAAVDTARSSGEAAAQAAQELVGAVGAVTDKVVEKIRGVKLPDGATLELSEGSPVDQIVRFLGEANGELPATFILDGLNFERASSRIAEDSMKIVVDLAATMKAYPAVVIRLDGHTDNTGSARNNKRLSAERAAAVREALLANGVAGERITTLGLGPDRPIAENQLAEGRARNRRVEVIITQR